LTDKKSRTERAPSPAESLLSVASHIPQAAHSRQNTDQSASRNTTYATTTNANNKRSRLTSVTSTPTEQYDQQNRGREIYNNQPPTSSSLHPSLPLPYANTHQATPVPVPGAEWAALNHTQLEGPGMPVARGNSHPMGIPINVPPPVASPVDPQDVDSGTGEVDADGEDNRKYCFCNNVSYGSMVACDDNDCEREWFHLGCVGMLAPPHGTWFCETCRAKRNKSRQGRGGRRRTGGAARNGAKA